MFVTILKHDSFNSVFLLTKLCSDSVRSYVCDLTHIWFLANSSSNFFHMKLHF
jgi:hypothetical protein